MQGLCVIGNFIPIIQNAPRGYAHFILYRNENQEIKGIIARMKRIKKQAVLESITLLESANEYVTVDLKPEELLNILMQCQEAAILTGNDLETQGEHTKELVTMLEEYCELIFQISQSMDDPENRKQLAQTVRNLLIRLHSKAVELLPEDRKEIVFFPYKASMWDSLESVWKAADADPECDAYVIPIPYYDKNPDGSFREMHYEGDLFPDYVPITRYDAYSLEERRPDAIYIHNPYDNCNLVTSIDPQYYASRLKNYTDCLIYIPYFVVDEVRNIDRLEHYVICPAVICADYVIVQSEKVKEKYGEILNRYFSAARGKKTDFSEKIWGIGSPKFDAVNKGKLRIQDLPEEWIKIIGNGDRKIIFYNTHLSLLMPLYYKRFLLKLKNVLAYFKQRNDVVLLWRPHPLAIQTIRSMNPAALEPYLEIVNQYKEEKWGIYDDTADMDRSIAISDAYYGSDSSLVPIYRQTGKPILLHSLNVPTEVI